MAFAAFVGGFGHGHVEGGAVGGVVVGDVVGFGLLHGVGGGRAGVPTRPRMVNILLTATHLRLGQISVMLGDLPPELRPVVAVFDFVHF